MGARRLRGDIVCMRRDPQMIVNLTRENVVCERASVAAHALTRMRGLLGRRTMPSGEGLLLRPASSIHTAFMRFPIDVVFLDGNLRVVKLVPQLGPWRTTAAAREAKAVLELPAGESARRKLGLLDRLAMIEPDVVPVVQQLPGAAGSNTVTGDPASGSSDSTGGAGADGAPRVLLVASDRRFRAVASALLARRGYAVAIGDGKQDVAELASRQHSDVVVIDASASLTAAAHEAGKLSNLRPAVGVVAVGNEPQSGLAALPVIPKWNSFETLFAAIEQARGTNRRNEARCGVGPA